MKNTKALLIQGPVKQILFKMTLPMIFAMIGMIAFNLIDTFFVGRLGTNELTALSFTFPVVLVIISVSLGLGVGVSAVVSKAIGKNNHEKVQRLTTDSLLLSLIVVIFFAIAGYFTIEPLFKLLGASQEILLLIKQYMSIWYWGVVFVVIPMVGNNAIRATGDTKTPAIIMLVAILVNIILDPLLIFGIGIFPRLGLQGAAIATVIARAVTLIFSLWVLYFRYDMINFKFSFRELINSWKTVLYIGLPVSLTKIITPLAIGIITKLLASYGPYAVAAFGVATRIEFLALAAVFALSSVIGPFVGQNWAAGKKERVNLGIKYSNKFSMYWGFTLFILLALFRNPIASLFTNNPEIISTISLYLLIVPICYGLFGVLLVSTTTLNVLHKPLHSAFIILIQMFVLYVPLAYLGSSLFGLVGIFTGITLAYLISGILSSIILKKVLYKNF